MSSKKKCVYVMVDVSAEAWNKAEISLIKIHENDDLDNFFLLLICICDAKKKMGW